MMEGWKEYKIEEFAEVVGGGTPSTKIDEYWNGDINWITPADLSGYEYKYISGGSRGITELGLKKSSAKLHPKNTILMTSRAPIGYLAIAKEEVATNQGFQSLRCNCEIADYNFVYYLLQIYANGIKAIASGATFPEVSGTKVKNFKMKLPPLKTQRKIASILSAYDDLIENNLKRIKLLEEQAQQTYEEWFVRFKFPGHETAVFDEESGLPVGWEKSSLGKIIQISSSKRIFLADYVPEGIPFYRGKEIILKSKNEALDDKLYISVQKFEEIKSKYDVPKEGDILVTAVGTLGYPYLVTKSDGDFYFKDGNLIWLKGNENISSFYLISSFKNEHFQVLLNNIAIGSSQKALTIRSLNTIEHIIPSISMQNKYDEIVIPIHNNIENLQNQNQLLKEARDILLPRLMMGVIDVEEYGFDSYLEVAEERSEYKST